MGGRDDTGYGRRLWLVEVSRSVMRQGEDGMMFDGLRPHGWKIMERHAAGRDSMGHAVADESAMENYLTDGFRWVRHGIATEDDLMGQNSA